MSNEVRRFFVDALASAGGEIALSSSAARHAEVLRLSVGDEVVLFDGSGDEASARIVATRPFRCDADVPARAAPNEPEVHLVQALPKGKKLEMIVRMATEIGVDGIHLAISERTISRPDADRGGARAARLLRIARESARQSRRRTVPDIHPPAPLHAVTRRVPSDAQKLVFWESAQKAVPKSLDPIHPVWVIVGPEGGLSHTEVSPLVDDGWSAVGLGTAILRVETAAPVAVALALDRVGRLASITGSIASEPV